MPSPRSSSAPMPAAAPARSSPTSRCSTRRSRWRGTSRRRCCWSIAASRRWRSSAGRDEAYAALRERHLDAEVPCAWLDATHPSYTLYTSGTTGRPKGVQRDTGGYAVALAASMTADLLRQRRRDLLLDQRHRLGRRPQLHRLRAADRRHGDDHVRGAADPSRRGHLVAPGREVQGDGDVQRADRDPGPEEAGPAPPARARPVEPALPLSRRRAARRADSCAGSARRSASP